MVVTNSAGSITSSSAQLTVTASGAAPIAPSITTQPADQTVQERARRQRFSVSATGTAPLTYQWLRNGAGDLPGRPRRSYTTPVPSHAPTAARPSR